MRKVIVGFAALGAVVGLLGMLKRGSPKRREHAARMAARCRQMAAQCRQMAAQTGDRGGAVGRA